MVPPVASRERSTASQSRGELTGWGGQCVLSRTDDIRMLGRVEKLVDAPRVVELYWRYGVACLEV